MSEEGGTGSGHFGHAGVPGTRGGSLPSGRARALTDAMKRRWGPTDQIDQAKFMFSDGSMVSGTGSAHELYAFDAYGDIGEHANSGTGIDPLTSFINETGAIRISSSKTGETVNLDFPQSGATDAQWTQIQRYMQVHPNGVEAFDVTNSQGDYVVGEVFSPNTPISFEALKQRVTSHTEKGFKSYRVRIVLKRYLNVFDDKASEESVYTFSKGYSYLK